MNILVLAIMVGFTLNGAMPAHGHGGKNHAEETFSAFDAVQKATQLYDRLIASGKLPKVWEWELKTIKISTRNTVNKLEYIVQFKTVQESPNSVYFFFDQDGVYSGSNFTGE
jgi:hypothetical protein